MNLFSRLPLLDPEVRYLANQDAPSIWAGVRLPDASRTRLIALHPLPPHLFQSSAGRDAQILLATLAARDGAWPTVVAGDLNAVPWERVVRRAVRIGGLLDPRVGLGLIPTFSTQSWWISWPLDHVLHQDSLGVAAVERLPAFGSDHYPYLVTLCHRPDLADRHGAPPVQSNDMVEAARSIRAARQDALPVPAGADAGSTAASP